MVRLYVYTDVACSEGIQAFVVVAPRGELSTTLPSSTSAICDEETGNLGALVLVPGGSNTDDLAVALMLRPDGTSGERCLVEGEDQCIIARRLLHFLPNESVEIRIDLRRDCLGIPCDEYSTCVRSVCVPAEIDPTKCIASPCDDSTMGGKPPVEGGDCEKEGEIRCQSTSGVKRVICEKSEWVGATSCEAGEACNILDGSCGEIVSECLGLENGALTCVGNEVRICRQGGLSSEGIEVCADMCVDGVCVASVCGNSVVEPGEECDDGNEDNTDGCLDTCKAASCGDGYIQKDVEACDDGNALGGDECSNHCQYVVEIASANGHSCARYTDGSLYCWGANDKGQLGQGHLVDVGGATRAIGPTDPHISFSGKTTLQPEPVSRLALGGDTSCALSGTSQLRCWGANDKGQLGLGDVTNRGGAPNEISALEPLSLPLGAIVDVGISTGHSCVVIANLGAYCWGGAAQCQLGYSTADTALGDAPGELSSNLTQTALSTKPSLLFVGPSYTGYSDLWNIFGTGTSQSFCLGNGVNLSSRCAAPGVVQTPIYTSSNEIVEIESGAGYWCWLSKAGILKCTGDNTYGQVDSGPYGYFGATGETLSTAPAPVLVQASESGVEIVSISAGDTHACALISDGSVRCWGDNRTGQLGIGSLSPTMTKTNQSFSGVYTPVDLGTPASIVQLSSGKDFNCALFSNHRVKCWGQNNRGQLGLGDTQSRGGNAADMGVALPYVPLP